MTEHMLTTVDNPWDPFTQFESWEAWDRHAGYHTLALQARIVNTSSDLSLPDQSLAIEQGIDEIISENVSGMHRKVTDPRTQKK